jgi:hypothetical protein
VIDIFRTLWINSKEGKKAFSRTIKMPPSQMVEPKKALQKIKSPTLILWGKMKKYWSEYLRVLIFSFTGFFIH